MSETQTLADAKFVPMQIGEAHERLHQVEVADRRHWAITITIMLALAVALYALTLPGLADSINAERYFRLVLRFVLLLVLVFGVLALRRQRLSAYRRRELASELAVIAASETLKIAIGKTGPDVERRSSIRAACDQRLSVTGNSPDGPQHFYGRIIDICEHGLGAIVPGVLAPGQDVMLEFSLDEDEESAARKKDSPQKVIKPMKLSAIVRQRSGFRYGFNFVAISDTDRERIESFRGADKVISIAGKGATASNSRQ